MYLFRLTMCQQKKYHSNFISVLKHLRRDKYNLKSFTITALKFTGEISTIVTIRILNVEYVAGCQMVRYLNGGLKTGLKKTQFMAQNVRYSNGQVK